MLLTSAVCILPLVFLAFIDLEVSRKATESGGYLHTSRLVSNTARTIGFFLNERRLALDFVAHDNTFEQLNDQERLQEILQNLRQSFEGFGDLGVIDPLGNQRNYVGPFTLEGKNYAEQEWYQQVLWKGVFISDVILGYRNLPHVVIAVKKSMPSGLFYVLRSSFDMAKFSALLSELDIAANGDAFVVNGEGVLQTSSMQFGAALDKISCPVPPPSRRTEVYESTLETGGPCLIGYRYIDDTPFILMVVKNKRELMMPWYETHLTLIGFLILCIIVIVLVIIGGTTFMVNRIYQADQKRLLALSQAEHSDKLAAIGRLAASVAHEINNPLAIINEKAGLMKDLFTFRPEHTRDEKLIGLVDAILSSVERCARITRRLLGFARHMDTSIQKLDIRAVVEEVLSLHGKEIEHRALGVDVQVPKGLPPLETDRGKLLQILLNLVNNAFAAMKDGGTLTIGARPEGTETLSLSIADNGSGIPEENLGRIFEPFFSTKTKGGGTGLGLFITYNLVKELGGNIRVESQEGRGTRFIIDLPLHLAKTDGESP